MKCSKCGFENDENSKFCNQCGAVLDDNLKKSKMKGANVIGIIVFSIIILIALILFISNLLGISSLNYPLTALTPQISYTFILAAGVLGVLSCAKNNKKILVSTVSFLLIGCLLLPVSKYINTMITRKDAAPEYESEELIENYKNDCVILSYDDMARNSSENEGKLVKCVGEVVQVISESECFSEYRINITQTNYGYTDTVYVTYPHYESQNITLLEDDFVVFYGSLGGIYTYESVSGESVSIPRIVSRYISVNENYEKQLKMLKEKCNYTSYSDLIELGKDESNKNTFVKFYGNIVSSNYDENSTIFLVKPSDAENYNEIIGVYYIEEGYIDTESDSLYLFYGTTDLNIVDDDGNVMPVINCGAIE